MHGSGAHAKRMALPLNEQQYSKTKAEAMKGRIGNLVRRHLCISTMVLVVFASLLAPNSVSCRAAEENQALAKDEMLKKLQGEIRLNLKDGKLVELDAQRRAAIVRQLQQRRVPVRIAPGMAVPAGKVNRRQRISLADGEIQSPLPDGTVQTQRVDAIPQLLRFVPGAIFVRAHEGDTVEKLAVKNGIEPDAARITTGTVPGHVYPEGEIVCLSRTYHCKPNETWQSVADVCGVTVEDLKRLNPHQPSGSRLMSSTSLFVPGTLRYQFRDGRQFNIVSIEYSQSDRRRGRARRPARPMFTIAQGDVETHRVKQTDTIETIARQHDVTPDFLRLLNGLGKDSKPRAGRVFYVRYTVRPAKGVTLSQLAKARRTSADTIRKLNKMKPKDKIVAGQALVIPARPDLARGN